MRKRGFEKVWISPSTYLPRVPNQQSHENFSLWRFVSRSICIRLLIKHVNHHRRWWYLKIVVIVCLRRGRRFGSHFKANVWIFIPSSRRSSRWCSPCAIATRDASDTCGYKWVQDVIEVCHTEMCQILINCGWGKPAQICRCTTISAKDILPPMPRHLHVSSWGGMC